MAQAPWVPLDATVDDGVTLSDKLNQSMPSIYSNHAGNAQPLQPLQGQFWVDTGALPVLSIKQYDGAAWRELWTVNASTGALGGPFAGGGGGGGGAKVTISDTPPATPQVGDLWFDSVRLNTFVYYEDANSSQWVQIVPTFPANVVPPGTIIHKAGMSIPAGYLQCHGQAISRVTYAALYLEIGTTYGAGDGSTTFNVPDLRGEFIRTLDEGRGIDTNRQLGIHQMDQFQSHQHNVTRGGLQVIESSLSASGGAPGTVLSTTAHASINYGGVVANSIQAFNGGSPRAGNETRPRNFAFPAFIKF